MTGCHPACPSSRKIGVYRAHRAAFGSVLHVVPREELRAKALEVAGTIAEKDPTVIRMAKESLASIDLWDVHIGSILEWTMDRFQDALLTEELDPGLFRKQGSIPEKKEARIEQFTELLRRAIGSEKIQLTGKKA